MPASFSNSADWRRVRTTVWIAALAALAGCTEPEIDRVGSWKATGVNDQNLSAMLVNPSDARVGSSAITARGSNGSRAVTRLLTDRRRPLLDASISKFGGSSSGGDGGSSGGGAGGGAAQ